MSEIQCPSGFLALLHSVKSQPLVLWEKKVRSGRVKRVTDEDLLSHALEMLAPKSATTSIRCPSNPEILDDKEVRRRFCISTFFAVAEVKPFLCKLPLLLEEGWNQITLPLHETVRKAYRTNYLETLRVQIYSNCRLGRVYFSDRPYSEEELPKEFRLYQHCIKIRSSKVVNLSSPPSPTVDQAALYN
ncbi:UNVERIFIED_CONTAM: hypothetical protein PYX00_000170 [Menopon gallinae]|uniref:CFA20 domain-containing protein n=1 Tax=Menopon gallinae TaxID=328185 RepID=A0AAW2I7Y3_9NEOP